MSSANWARRRADDRGQRGDLVDHTFEQDAPSPRKIGGVELIEHSRQSPADFVRDVARQAAAAGRVLNLPNATRLALEMASHEESERRAMEGELALLEAAWKQAEEIAKIADNLLVPPSVDEFVERNRAKR